MKRTTILGTASALLLVVLAITIKSMIAMSEEEQMALAIRMSEESARKEEAAILQPGIYEQYIDIPEGFRFGRSQTRPFKVYQIAVMNPQSSENISCGPRVLFMAHAIDALYKKNILIGAHTINHELSSNAQYTQAIRECAVQLDADDFKAFIETNHLSIEQYAVMGRNVTQEGVYTIIPYLPEGEPARLEMWLKFLGQELEADRITHPLHFIFNDTSKQHWVLISVIKEKDTNPIVYYIDPKNVNLSSYVVAHNYIEYVVDKLELPFPKNR